MSELIVAYWSGTGNTEAMAQCIGEGIEAAGGTAKVIPMEAITPADLKADSVFALGCPAMGAEELEESTVEPFVSELETFAGGKKIALFGSYDWGDGEWMQGWADRMGDAGAAVIGGEGVICQGTPDDVAKEALIALGKEMAAQ